jgi:predicted metal-dependent hydrolase
MIVSRSGLLQVDDLAVEVTVRRVKRMNVRVHPPLGSVRLSVPPRTSDRAVIRFVRESRSWIDHHRARIADEELRAARRPRPLEPRGEPGEVWWWFGRALRLRVLSGPGSPSVEVLPDGLLCVRLPGVPEAEQVLAALDRWQRRELRTEATTLLDHWAPRMGVRYDFLGIRRMTTRWGSCVPGRRRIWLNLTLVTRPPELLEYVVVHELAHLRVPSHGAAFKDLMSAHLPDWSARRQRLDASV